MQRIAVSTATPPSRPCVPYYFVSPVGCVAYMNLCKNSCFVGVTCGQSLGKRKRLLFLHKVDGATAEAASCEPGANDAGQLVRQHYQGVRLHAACLKIEAVAGVSLSHQPSQFFQVMSYQCICSGH